MSYLTTSSCWISVHKHDILWRFLVVINHVSHTSDQVSRSPNLCKVLHPDECWLLATLSTFEPKSHSISFLGGSKKTPNWIFTKKISTWTSVLSSQSQTCRLTLSHYLLWILQSAPFTSSSLGVSRARCGRNGGRFRARSWPWFCLSPSMNMEVHNLGVAQNLGSPQKKHGWFPIQHFLFHFNLRRFRWFVPTKL